MLSRLGASATAGSAVTGNDRATVDRFTTAPVREMALGVVLLTTQGCLLVEETVS